jgi:hypothetical protein
MFRTLFLLIASAILFSGCNNHNNTIPENEMATILYKMYLVDGTLSMPASSREVLGKDSLNYYGEVFKSEGCTPSQFRSSFFYYLGKPEILDGIYDKVILKLEIDNQSLDDSLAKQNRTQNLWNKPSTWNLSNQHNNEKLEFSIPITHKGTYTLKMVAFISPKDMTNNLRLVVGTTSNVSAPIEKLDNKQTIVLTKTNKTETYTATIDIPDNNQIFIKGRMLDFDNNPATPPIRFVIIRRISLTTPTVITKTNKITPAATGTQSNKNPNNPSQQHDLPNKK